MEDAQLFSQAPILKLEDQQQQPTRPQHTLHLSLFTLILRDQSQQLTIQRMVPPTLCKWEINQFDIFEFFFT